MLALHLCSCFMRALHLLAYAPEGCADEQSSHTTCSLPGPCRVTRTGTAPSALLAFQRIHCRSMKRKHDALFSGHTELDNEDAQHSFAHRKIGQYLRGQDLLTESVL